MKVFQELRTAIDSWEENNSLLLKLCGEFDCEKSELLATICRWKEEQPITNKERIKELLNHLRETADEAHGKTDSANDSFSRAFSEMEYVDAEDAVYSIEDITSAIDDALSELNGNSEKSEKE